MLIKDCRGKIKVGDWVKTNGSDVLEKTEMFEGEIGEILENNFYVWQNFKSGTSGFIHPTTKGYSYSWVINFNNPNEIDIIKSAETAKSVDIIKQNNFMNTLTSKIKRLFNENAQKQYKAGLIDECFNLTSKGEEELRLIIRDKFEEDLVKVAEDIIKEEEGKK